LYVQENIFHLYRSVFSTSTGEYFPSLQESIFHLYRRVFFTPTGEYFPSLQESIFHLYRRASLLFFQEIQYSNICHLNRRASSQSSQGSILTNSTVECLPDLFMIHCDKAQQNAAAKRFLVTNHFDLGH
jgi:hypothetical protein